MIKEIFKTALRVFAKGVGALLGCILFIVVLGVIAQAFISEGSSDTKSLSFKSKYSPTVLENSQGVRKVLDKKAPVILTLSVNGAIGLKTLNQETIAHQLVESREGLLKEGRVKALFIEINSPGGTVFDSDGIYRLIKTYKEKYQVPVYAYVDGLCASGGMYVASAADKIYASNVSLVGSVGVIISPFINFSKVLENIGVETKTISLGIGKDAMNPMRPWKQGEASEYEKIVAAYYDQFVGIVSAARPELTRALLVEKYGANVFPAKEAEEIGMIDKAGLSRNQALEMLIKELNLEPDAVQIVGFKSGSWVEELFQEKSFLSSKMVHQIKMPGMLPEEFNGKLLYLFTMQEEK
jgi:protease IV